MNELMSLIKGRRSIRSFQEKEIPEELTLQVLESIRWSPSWANTQCWEVILIKDRAIKEGLQGVLHEKNPAKNAVLQAPVVIALCGKKGIAGYYKGKADTKLGDWLMFDLGLASQNACLTAHGLGLGTVIVGALDHERGRDLLKVKEGYELLVLIPMGYPAKSPPAPKRKGIDDFVHHEYF